MRLRATAMAISVAAATVLMGTTPAYAGLGWSGGNHSSLYYTNSSTVMCVQVQYGVQGMSGGQLYGLDGFAVVQPQRQAFPLPTQITSGFYSNENNWRSAWGVSDFEQFLC
jgi:hypothetical protein